MILKLEDYSKDELKELNAIDDINEVDNIIYYDDKKANNKWLDVFMVGGNGQYHTAAPGKKNQKPYNKITMIDVFNSLKYPSKTDKSTAPWIIFSDLINENSRKHDVQRQSGNYYALWLDIDDLNGKTFDDVAKEVEKMECKSILYTTSSATLNNQKCRVIFPLKNPCIGKDFEILQKILNNKFKNFGIIPDTATERAGQLCYLPNEGEFYKYKTINNKPFFDYNIWKEEINNHHSNNLKKYKKNNNDNKKIKSILNNPIEAYNNYFTLEKSLLMYDYIKIGDKYLSPLSESGIPGVSILGNKWHSHHSSDLKIGKLSDNNTTSGDSFDLFVYYENDGNYNKAIASAAELFEINKIDEKSLKETAKKILESKEPCQKFDINILPDLWKEYIEYAILETAADPLMITQSLMCSISAIIGKKIYIDLPDFFNRLYPNIWCCSLSESGNFKTTALNKGSIIADRIDAEITEKINFYKTEEGRKIFSIENEEEKLQAQSPILSDKVTAEGLFDELETGQGGMIKSSEMGGWLQRMCSNHTGDLKATLTDFYDVPVVRTMRTRTGGKTMIKEPYITINGVSTVDWIKANLQSDDVSSGFFARFLLFYPPQHSKRPSALPDNNINPNNLNKIADKIYNKLKEIRNKDAVQYHLSPEAKELYQKYYDILWDAIESEETQLQKVLNPYLKRWTPYILKIAMIAQPFYKSNNNVITDQALVFSKYIIDYAIKSTTYLFSNELGESDHQRKCRLIKEYIAKKDGQIKWKALITSKVLTGGAKDYEYIIETLIDSDIIAVSDHEVKAKRIISLK